MIWLWWVAAALVLATLEMLSLDLVLLMLAGGALAGAVAAGAGAPVPVQVLVAAVAAVVLLFALRPWMLRHVRAGTHTPTNADSLVGRSAIVVEAVSAKDGQVRLDGALWTARTTAAEPIEEGADVLVVRIEGATAVVAPAPHYGSPVRDE